MKSGAKAACFAIPLLVTSPALAGAGGVQVLKDPSTSSAQDQSAAPSGSKDTSPATGDDLSPPDGKDTAAQAIPETPRPDPAPDEKVAPPDGKDPAGEANSGAGEPRPAPDENLSKPDRNDPAAQPEEDPPPKADEPPGAADMPSTEAMAVIDWVIAVHDNNDLPFMVIDKVAAEVFLFDPSGQRIAAAPALVGMATGDEETAATGDRELSSIKPADRKTPAGRFIAKFGYAAGGHEVLWVDYPSAISLHAVINVRNQHRLERLKSPTPDDNRITYGCINVPAAFYAKFVKPIFKATPGVVYILPESKSLNEVFLAMPQQPGARETLSQSQ